MTTSTIGKSCWWLMMIANIMEVSLETPLPSVSAMKGWLISPIVILGGFFKARLQFPKEYPLMPPKMKFETPIWHPNSTLLPHTPDTKLVYANDFTVYENGNVCISILHPPEDDKSVSMSQVDLSENCAEKFMWQIWLRIRQRTLATRSHTRDYPHQCHFYAQFSQRRKPGKHRRRETVARRSCRIQEESSTMRKG